MFRPSFILAVLAISLAGSSRAGTNLWTTNGPDGADVFTIAVPAISSSTVLAVSGVVYRSSDDGATWALATGGTGISEIAFHPTSATTAYAAGSEGAAMTSDGGATWTLINNGITITDGRAIAVDPGTPSTLYYGVFNAFTPGPNIFKSVDGGANWSPASTGLPQGYAEPIIIDPSNPTTVYAIASGKVYKSINEGTSWSLANSGLPCCLNDLAIDPLTTSTLYAATFTGIYKTTNGGSSWVSSSTGLSTNSDKIVVDPSNPSILYVATSNDGVYRSANSGSTWTRVSTGLSTVTAHDITLKTNLTTRLYAATPAGVETSTDSGNSWARTNTGIRRAFVGWLALHGLDSSSIFAGGSALNKSTDGGTTWTNANAGQLPNYLLALVRDPTDPLTLFAAGNAGLGNSGRFFKSTNGGASWSATGTGLPAFQSIRVIAVHPTTPSIVYAGTDSSGFFVSTNGGATFSASSLTGISPISLAFAPTNPDVVFAGTSSGIFKSTDGGSTWNAMNSGVPNPGSFDLEVSPVDELRALVITRDGPFLTIDGGLNWTPATTGIIELPTGNASVAFDPLQPAVLYCTANTRVYRSVKNPPQWVEMTQGIPTSTDVWVIAPHPTVVNRLYVGTNKGVFERTLVAGVSTTGIVATTEGGATATITIVLDAPPAADVTIAVSSSDTTEGTVGSPSLTFTPANWNIPQNIVVTPVDDSIDDGLQSYTILIGAASSEDPLFAGFDPPDVAATNDDDDEISPTDLDGDGVPNTVEQSGPNGGDANHDSIPDAQQPTVATLRTADASAFLTVTSNCDLRNVAAVAPSSIAAAAPVVFPFGLVEFRLPCSSAQMEILFHGNLAAWDRMHYFKFGPTTPGGSPSQWYELPGVTFDTHLGAGRTRFTLTDGGLGDDTAVDGWIVDQGGPGPFAPIPTSSAWALLALTAALGAIAIYLQHRI